MKGGPGGAARTVAAVLAVLAAAVAGSVVINAASFGPVSLQRLREPTLLFWIATFGVLLVRDDRGAAWDRVTSTVGAWLGSRRGLVTIIVAGGVLSVASSLTHHLAFNTYSHDLGMYQEALARAWQRPPLFSSILGSSFLGEHFSPILFALAPIYQLLPFPLTLVALNALLLWIAVFPLAAVTRELGLPRPVGHLLCLVYLFFPVVARSAGYPFHHEVLYPVVLIALYLAFLRDRRVAGAALVLAAVAIKEDAGLYLLGMGVFFGLHHRRWRWGSAVAVTGVVSTLVAVLWVIPYFGSDAAGYAFQSRWAVWFHPAGWPTAVSNLLAAIGTEDVLTVVAATLLVPLRGSWTWVVVAIPVLLNLTSSTPIQAQLGLYYGLPVAATAAIAAAAALAQRPTSRRAGVALAAAAMVINVAAFTYPEIPACRGRVLAELERIDAGRTVAESGCFDPLLQRLEHRRVLVAGKRPSSDLVLLRTGQDTWPLSREQAAELAASLDRDPAYFERFRCGGFVFYERRSDEP